MKKNIFLSIIVVMLFVFLSGCDKSEMANNKQNIEDDFVVEAIKSMSVEKTDGEVQIIANGMKNYWGEVSYDFYILSLFYGQYIGELKIGQLSVPYINNGYFEQYEGKEKMGMIFGKLINISNDRSTKYLPEFSTDNYVPKLINPNIIGLIPGECGKEFLNKNTNLSIEWEPDLDNSNGLVIAAIDMWDWEDTVGTEPFKLIFKIAKEEDGKITFEPQDFSNLISGKQAHIKIGRGNETIHDVKGKKISVVSASICNYGWTFVE
jgi:hypothetical protein